MVLTIETKIHRGSEGATHYIVIPAAITRDSQYPFEDFENVTITIYPEPRIMILSGKGWEPLIDGEGNIRVERTREQTSLEAGKMKLEMMRK